MSEQFQPEVKKFKWLLTEGYITPQELTFYSNFYDIQMTSIVSFQGHDVLTPLFIVARPSRFYQIKRELPQAEIADPYSKKFPIISLLSLEKFINSLITLKIPYFFFSVFLHNSYNNAPPHVHGLLYSLINLVNSSYRYVIKPYNIIETESVSLSNDLQKIICHAKKMLGEKDNCDDKEWWKYNLWGKNTTSTAVDRRMIERLALKYNVSPICIHYVLAYNKNPCNLSSDVINKIKSDLSSSSSS